MQGLERRLHLLGLAAHPARHVLRMGDVAQYPQRLRAAERQIAVLDVRAHHRNALLADALDVRRTRRHGDVRQRRQADLPLARVHEQVLHVRLRVALAFLQAHPDVHALVAPCELRRHVAADLAHHPVGHVGHQQASRCRALLVELDLQLRVAGADAGFHVAERRRRRHLGDQSVRYRLDRREVVAGDFHFERCRKGEQLRPVHLELGARNGCYDLARQRHDERLVVRTRVVVEHHAQLADLLAAPCGAGVQLAARAGDRVRALDDRICEQLLLDLGEHAVGQLEPCAGLEFHVDAELVLRQRRDQFEWQARRQGRDAAQTCEGDRERQRAEAQGPQEQYVVGRKRPLVSTVEDPLDGAEQQRDHARDRAPQQDAAAYAEPHRVGDETSPPRW